MSVTEQLKTALSELFASAPVVPGQILVVGCSTSEIFGKKDRFFR